MPEGNVETARLKAELVTFNAYLNDLNSDYGVGNNKKIIKITRKLVELEFDKVKGDLPEDEQARFDALITSRVKAKKGEVDSEEEPDLTIGNNGDGTIIFDFLSDEYNKNSVLFRKN